MNWIKKKAGYKLALWIGLVEIASMMTLFFIIDRNISKVLETNAIRDMSVIAADRAALVESYISRCCEFLDGYRKSDQIINVLEQGRNPDAIKAAREYTDLYSSGREFLEGLYVAEWDTYVLAHINPDSVDQTFRTPEAAKALEEMIRKTKSHSAPA